ncbi:MAG: hypothetical protein AAFV45_00500 [Pseudomonadota bacterium]
MAAFGEMALLTVSTRSATTTAVSSADLFVLEVHDFLRLLDRQLGVKKVVEEVADKRRITCLKT